MSKKKEKDGASKLPRKYFDEELTRLQAELVKLQYWVQVTAPPGETHHSCLRA